MRKQRLQVAGSLYSSLFHTHTPPTSISSGTGLCPALLRSWALVVCVKTRASGLRCAWLGATEINLALNASGSTWPRDMANGRVICCRAPVTSSLPGPAWQRGDPFWENEDMVASDCLSGSEWILCVGVKKEREVGER